MSGMTRVTASLGSAAKYAMFAASVVVFSAMLNHQETDRDPATKGRYSKSIIMAELAAQPLLLL